MNGLYINDCDMKMVTLCFLLIQLLVTVTDINCYSVRHALIAIGFLALNRYGCLLEPLSVTEQICHQYMPPVSNLGYLGNLAIEVATTKTLISKRWLTVRRI